MQCKHIFFSFLIVFLFAVSFAANVSANGDDDVCGAPAFWEAHKTYADVSIEAALLVVGIAVAAFGFMKLQKNKKIAAIAVGILLIAGAAAHFFTTPPLVPELLAFGPSGSTHEHADFAVFINGVAWNFSQAKYMTLPTGLPKSGLAHLHDGFGSVMHKHGTGVTFAYFFKTLGWKLSDACIVTDDNTSFCSYGDSTLQLFVNGKRFEGKISEYSPNDLDKVLFVYGTYSPTQLSDMQLQITNYSCIYSQKCAKPEGFVLPPENCAVG